MRTQHPDVNAGPAGTTPDGALESSPGRSPWWRHLAVILLLAVLTRLGLYFTGLVAMLILLTDMRRHPYTRLANTVVMAWWTFAWARSSVPPLIGLGLLLAAAGAYVISAWQQLPDRRAVARNAVFAVAATGMAVLNVAPDGLRTARLDKAQALSSALAASRGEVRATQAQVIRTRERFTQRPIYLVLLFEPNPRAATTRDGEPCFQREEVHVVNGLTGAVDKRGLIDKLMLTPSPYQVAQAREKDGNCLPLPRGTSLDIVAIPGR